MKREIKFKAWNKTNNTMHDFINSVDNWSFAFLNQDIFKWLEYTGLKDKSGKEICEGDILLTWYSRDTSGKDIIVMKTTVEHEINHESTGFEIPFLHTAKIIGNIYENPDLLDTEEAQLSEQKAE